MLVIEKRCIDQHIHRDNIIIKFEIMINISDSVMLLALILNKRPYWIFFCLIGTSDITMVDMHAYIYYLKVYYIL